MTTQNERAVVSDGFEEELREILVTSAGLPPSSLDNSGSQSLADLGMDSLATMELQAIVQTRHGVQLPDEALTMSVLELAEFMRSQLGKEN